MLNRRRGQISSTPTQPRDRLEYNLDEREDNGDRTWRTPIEVVKSSDSLFLVGWLRFPFRLQIRRFKNVEKVKKLDLSSKVAVVVREGADLVRPD